MEQEYINEFHRKSSLASQEAVQSMLKKPLSLEQMEEQIRRHRASDPSKKKKSKSRLEKKDIG